jgi:hypothetical protein
MVLVSRQIILGVDRLYRAFRHAEGAIDALIRVDHQKIRPFMKAVHRAHIHTVGVFTFDARFGNNIGHGWTPFINNGAF